MTKLWDLKLQKYHDSRKGFPGNVQGSVDYDNPLLCSLVLILSSVKDRPKTAPHCHNTNSSCRTKLNSQVVVTNQFVCTAVKMSWHVVRCSMCRQALSAGEPPQDVEHVIIDSGQAREKCLKRALRPRCQVELETFDFAPAINQPTKWISCLVKLSSM